MPSIGERIQLDITGLTHDGHGVGRYQGLAVFVPGALPEETVEATVTEVRPRFARASLMRIVSESAHRVSPNCPLAAQGWCGGCGLGHLAYEAQLRHKTTRVKEALSRIGGLPGVEVKECLPSPSPVAYRNKVQYAVTAVDKQWRLGLMETGTHTAHPAEDCPAAHPGIRQVARRLAALLNEFGTAGAPNSSDAPAAQPAPTTIRNVVIRFASATGEIMVILVTPSRSLPIWSRLSARLFELCPEVKSLVHLVNPRPSGTVLAGERVRVEGRPYIEDELLGLRFRISPESFYQVNLAQTANLYGKALEYAGLSGASNLPNSSTSAIAGSATDAGLSVLDVYCGIGTITLLAARHAREAIGVESIPAAVEDAARNATLNDLHNTRFLAGPAERLLPRLAHDGFRPDVVIVDPPRAGVEKAALDSVITIAPPRLVYVSCDPESLARDLGRLSAAGYAVRQVQPVDMFPQTSHTEAVALVTRE